MLMSYGAALKELGLAGAHDFGGRKNNRVENFHLPVRQLERRMQWFKSPERHCANYSVVERPQRTGASLKIPVSLKVW